MLGLLLQLRPRRLQERHRELQRAVDEARASVEVLYGLLPIRSARKKIREDSGYWTQVEAYIGEHSRAEFTHGICPDRMHRLYPDITAKLAGSLEVRQRTAPGQGDCASAGRLKQPTDEIT